MNAHNLANDLFNASLATIVITLVASLGMTHSVSQILAPVKRVRLLLGTLLANSALAWLIAIAKTQSHAAATARTLPVPAVPATAGGRTTVG